MSVHVIAHVEPPVQLTLLLGPTVMSQLEPPAQLTVQEAPHDPLHWLSSTQAREQLSPTQALSWVSHASPALHVHDAPAHSGGGGTSSPQPQRRPRERTSAKDRARISSLFFRRVYGTPQKHRRARRRVVLPRGGAPAAPEE